MEFSFSFLCIGGDSISEEPLRGHSAHTVSLGLHSDLSYRYSASKSVFFLFVIHNLCILFLFKFSSVKPEVSVHKKRFI
jgi:hypothetical protein